MPKVKSESASEKKGLGIRPLNGYILVQPSAAETKTASGLYLPESTQEKPAQGTVLAVGGVVFEMGREIFPPVNIGDKIIYKKWGGDELKVGGVEYKLVKFDDVMAILE